MSTLNNGPQIIQNGLVLNLDAGNSDSYSTNRFQSLGSGTVTENVNFALQSVAGFQRIAFGTVIGGYTVKPTDVVYSYALGSNACHFHGNTAPIPSGVYATFSVDYLVTGATNYPSTNFLISFENYGGGALGGSAGVANSVQNVWQRATFTSGPTSSAGSQAMFLYPGGCGTRLADSGTIYFRNPKVEWTNVDTGNSTFSSTSNISIWYDLSGNGNDVTMQEEGNINWNNSGYFTLTSNGYFNNTSTTNLPTGNSPYTLSVWVQLDLIWGAQGMISISDTWGSGNSVNAFRTAGTNTLVNYWWGNDLVAIFNPPASSVWFNFVAKWDGTNRSIWANGIAITEPQTVAGLNVYNGVLNIGNTNNGEYLQGNIGQALIYDIALSSTQIMENFDNTKSNYGY